ncbi:MAG: hypothetical protein K1000chlam4_01031, partial [Chlamydiae bacterium]|nr:hypothetical protein [Chlamydiota bacterium]
HGDPVMKNLVDSALAQLKAPPSALFSVMGRHLARALSAKFIADSMEKWLLELKPGEPTFVEYTIPEEGMGVGFDAQLSNLTQFPCPIDKVFLLMVVG